MLTVSETAALLRTFDNVLILTHIRPDGDTVGCAAALCAGLWSALAAKTLADAPAAAMLPLCAILCAAIYLGLLKAPRA